MGFIAVYNGRGALLWTHQFQGLETFDCAITDVSIRVETRSETKFDVVTYCGISSHGNPSGSTQLEPLRRFLAPGSGSANCYSPAAGDQNSGTDQWDGIVGRLVNDHNNPTTVLTGGFIKSRATREFHSIVGGDGQDGLFGLAEIDKDRFVTVGSTTWTGGTSSSVAYPFTFFFGTPPCLSTASAYCVGTFMIFDASAIPSGGNLSLQHACPLGTVSSSVHTWARDVCVVGEWAGTTAMLHVVGSTDDSSFRSSVGNAGGHQTSLAGAGTTDGFLVSFLDNSSATNPATIRASFHGSSSNEGLTGVAVWNEFSDHVVVVGSSQVSTGNVDISIGSLRSVGLPSTNDLLRSSNTGGSSLDVPCAMGATNVFMLGPSTDWSDPGTLEHPQGGGVCMDQSGRVNAVGATLSSNYPISSSTSSPTSPFPGRSFRNSLDAIRTVFDPLPVGISRTDGTGSIAGGNIVSLPSGGIDGGTTPPCGKTPFGLRINEAAPEIKRMLFDYQGPAPQLSVTPTFLIDRPHFDSSSLIASALDVGFPLSSPLPINQMEVWLNPSTAVTSLLSWTPGTTLSFQLGALSASTPPGSVSFTLQVFFFLNNNVCGASLGTVASPALTIHY